MIFAAGLGTRLKPITDTIPKALLPLNGKPLLQYQIEKLSMAGITDIVINVHHFADKIIEYLRGNDNFGCRIAVSDERVRLLDTGGGLLYAKHLLEGEQPILALNVDIISNIDINEFVGSGLNGVVAKLVVSERKTQRYLLFDKNRMVGWTNISTGEIRPADVDFRGVGLSGLSHLAFSGMQLLSPRVFGLMDEVVRTKGDKFSLIDFYLSICRTETIAAYVPGGYRMMDVGKIDQLSAAEAFVSSLPSDN